MGRPRTSSRVPSRTPGERPAERPATRHVEGKRRVRRARILESAVRSFAERGYHRTSMDDIAGALRLSRGSLYYYFRDKEEILAACHAEALEAVLDVLASTRRDRLAPDAALRRLVVEHVRIMVDQFHGTALALDFDALGGARRQDLVALRDRFERGLRATVADGVASGLFRPIDPKLAGFAIFGAVNWIARWYRPAGEAPAERVGEAFADLFLSGLRARPTSEVKR